jgi:hypothetical protein
VHFLLIHLLTIPFAYVRYGRVAFLFEVIPTLGGSPDSYPTGFGYSLPAVYGAWVLVVAMMYPMCLWFGGLKERHRNWWLGYL